MPTLEQILGTVGLPIEHDGVKFRLVPFTSAEVVAWNRATFGERDADSTGLEHAEKVQKAQLELIARKMKFCVADGKSTKVTPKWVGENFPQTILQDIAEFLANGTRPAWAGEQGN